MLNIPYKSHITIEEFEKNSGYNLTDRLSQDDGPNESEIASRFLTEIAGMVYQLISSRRGDAFAKTLYSADDDEVNEILALAEYYQAVYIFENGGSLSAFNGSDNFININELRGYRNYDEKAITILENNGFLYCGVM